MRLFLVNFAACAAITFLQIDCQAGDDALKEKIVRAALNHNEPALIKVSTNGVTSLEFPYKIEAIDGYGFSQSPGAGDAFQISYTKGTNYFSVRALKPGVTGNLTVVLDQKVYAIFFEESSDPSFVNIFSAANNGGLAAVDERAAPQVNDAALAEEKDPAAHNDFDLEMKQDTGSKSEGLAFSQPPSDYLPTKMNIEQSRRDLEVNLVASQVADQRHQSTSLPEKHASPKKGTKKPDPKPEKNVKESVAKTQKPPAKKLFGWL